MIVKSTSLRFSSALLLLCVCFLLLNPFFPATATTITTTSSAFMVKEQTRNTQPMAGLVEPNTRQRFLPPFHAAHPKPSPPSRPPQPSIALFATATALGEYSLQLEKPLGMILEEQDNGVAAGAAAGGGVRVKSLISGGSAASSGIIAPGDVILAVNDDDTVATADFDTVMELLRLAPPSSLVRLRMSDGLGRMDISPAVARQFRTKGGVPDVERLLLIDSVVRAAVRCIRQSQRLGDLLRVEIVIGAGIREEEEEEKTKSQPQQQQRRRRRCLVRFFAIFSTDGVSTYSCNVSATGIVVQKKEEEEEEKMNGGSSSNSIEIVELSCAKDEGLGQTIDLIRER